MTNNKQKQKLKEFIELLKSDKKNLMNSLKELTTILLYDTI